MPMVLMVPRRVTLSATGCLGAYGVSSQSRDRLHRTQENRDLQAYHHGRYESRVMYMNNVKSHRICVIKAPCPFLNPI